MMQNTMMQKPMRPTGITVLAILAMIFGVIAILGGVFVAAVGGSSILALYGYGAFSGLLSVLGVAVAVYGFLIFIFGWGMWTGKGWAWILGVILVILGILSGLGSLGVGNFTSIGGLIIDVIILWYLFRPHVKAYFGRGTPTMQQAPQPAPAPTQ
jgi:hypothetical protein